MRRILSFLFTIIAFSAFAQGYINPPSWADGHIFAGPGTTINTNVITSRTTPNNLFVLSDGAIATWNITLPYPTFDGQIISIGCPGGSVTLLSVGASAPDQVISSGVTSCTTGYNQITSYQYRDQNSSGLGYGVWIPLFSTSGASISKSIQTDTLTVTAPNVVSSLSKIPNGSMFLLIVNGVTIISSGTSPPYTISGTTITWSATNAGYSLASTDSVIAVYTHN